MDSAGEDIPGNIVDSYLAKVANVTEDCVDAKPDCLSIIFPPRKETPKINVDQCKDDLYYNTSHLKRGLAVIFNHENFTMPTLKPRTGTNVDCQNLTNTLQNMNFDVIIHPDLYFKQLDAILDELCSLDFSDCDCLLVIVLSHGEQNVVYAKNMSYSTNVLFDRFTPDKCPTLAGKPKIFVIQACQGDKFDGGIDVQHVDIDKVDAGIIDSYRMPLYADFLFIYSTIPGYYSWRNTLRGSWFIQAFCEEFNRYWQDFDFVTILAFVNRKVACDFESNVPKNLAMHRQKQTSTFTSQLTRILKFTPKNGESNDICK